MHWFDGLSKLHSFKFEGNTQTIKFSSRFLETNSYAAAKNNALYLTTFFGDVEPSLNIIQRIIGFFNIDDNTNVNVFDFGDGKLCAISDHWLVNCFDKNTLSDSIMVQALLPPELPEEFNRFTIMSVAHPLKEYGTSATITLALIISHNPFVSGTVNLIRVHSIHNRELIASINVDRTPYMHSFALTENYAILFADPIFIHPFSIFIKGNVVDAFEWDPEQGTTVYIISLKDGSVEILHIPALFHVHHVNAFEKNNGEIVVQCATHSRFDVYSDLQRDWFSNKALRKLLIDIKSTFITYVIDASHTNVIRQPVTNQLSTRLDFLTINEEYRFRENRYIYGVVPDVEYDDYATIAIVKRDVIQGNDTVWYMPSHYPSEAIFVPKPNAVSEDDGVLLSVVLDGNRRESYLLVLDAKTMSTQAVSLTPHNIPGSFHGQFFDD